MKRALVLLAALATAACDLSMAHQPGDRRQDSAQRWTGGPPREAPPEGTIALDAPARASALVSPPALTPALLDRGEERYGIYCAVCHGARGDGDGMIVRRGFPPPPSLHDARLVAAPPAYIVDVITHGHGVMYSYADRVEPADRWAIAAYVKALQRAGVPEPRR